MAAALWQFAGSLVAVASLTWLAFRFGFSGRPQFHDGAEAERLADEISGGFRPVATLLSASRSAALLRDEDDRLALVAPSGAHFVVRLLSPSSSIVRRSDLLEVRDGKVTGEFSVDAEMLEWERALARLR
ncbi:hypothetical protein [Croceibacterium aestuarii]|uniref:hypothetical protein n=1 Tax=Croceibacterium aestuarii TaxID=3064139 RepID=UPI00272EB713|nr:hypothetical protein [Croceibacterium sp. D39]